MRTVRLILVGCCVLVLTACGSKPTDTTPASSTPPAAKAADASNTPAAKPAELILGEWEMVSGDKDKRIAWEYKKQAIAKGEKFELMVNKNGKFLLGTEGGGSIHEFKFLGDDVLEVITGSIPPLPPKKLKVKVTKDELSLTDEKGMTDSYKRMIKPVDVTIWGLPLYSDKCVEALKEALAKVDGVSVLSVDQKNRTASVKLRNRLVDGNLGSALQVAGFSGTKEKPGEKPSIKFKTVVGPSGDPVPALPSELTITQVHACCPECQKVINGLVKNATVTYVGSGPVKTLKITGKDLKKYEILEKLDHAGFGFSFEDK